MELVDLIVNLYQKDFLEDINIDPFEKLSILPKNTKTDNTEVKRLLSPDSDKLVEFVKKTFNDEWASEVKAAAYKENPTCFIAVKDKKIIGFACFDATAKSYFGPTGISKEYRGLGIGRRLLLYTLDAMKQAGYGYAIIGSVGNEAQNFYSKYIEFTKSKSKPNLYSRCI